MDTNGIIPTVASGGDLPKKYIRTFEGDMQTLKEGGTPDLAPFNKESEFTEPKTSSTMPATVVSMQDTALPPDATGSPPPAPSKPKEEVVKPIPLQTYEGDFSKQMKDTKASMATVLAAEQDSATGEPQPSVPQSSSKSNRIYIIVGVVLLILGAGGAYYAYTLYSTAVTPVSIQPSVSAPIFVDEREQITGMGSVLAQAIEQSVAKPLAPNTVRLLTLVSATTSNESVFSALHLGAPDILLRNVNTRGSIAGVVSTEGSKSPFFILSVASYSDTFAGMLSWEPQIVKNMEVLYPPHTPLVVSTISTTSTSSGQTSSPQATKAATTTVPTNVPQNFKDEVVSNHDVRMYRDAFGQSVVLYGYWNKTTLIIARDPVAFIEIVDRLATSRTAP